MIQRVACACILVLALVPVVLFVSSPTARAERATHAATRQTRPAAPNAKPATTFFVTSTADSGVGSLRSTVAGAGTGDVIMFALTLPNTIALSSEIGVSDLTITGPTTGTLTISGGGGTRISSATRADISNLVLANGGGVGFGGAVYSVDSTFTNVTFRNNLSSALGGAIFDLGYLTVTNSSFISNRADSKGGAVYIHESAVAKITNSTFVSNTAGAAGGSIYNGPGGTTTITNSTFVSNAAFDGGAIYGFTNGTTTITETTFVSNTATSAGGGIYNNDGTTTIMNSTFVSNTAFSGGGIYNYSGGTMTITNSTIGMPAGVNQATNGGGIFNSSGATLMLSSNVTVTNNSAVSGEGGGIFNGSVARINMSTISLNSAPMGGGISHSGFNSTLIITDTTINGNTAFNTSGGGVLLSGGLVTITGSTISSNQATDASLGTGGGIYQNSGSIWLSNSTLSGNKAAVNCAGIGISTAAYLNNVTIANNQADSDNNLTGAGGGTCGGETINNTIVAGNYHSTTPEDCAGTMNSQGHNLIQNVGCSIIGTTTGNILNMDPKLGPLANNGGPTKTHALFAGSPAIDGGDDATCLAKDQRGVSRAAVGAHCDIGAYEGAVWPLYLPLILK